MVRSRKDNFKRVDTAPIIPCFKMISEIIKVNDVISINKGRRGLPGDGRFKDMNDFRVL